MNGITPHEGSSVLPPIVSAFLRQGAPPLSREEIDGIYTVGVRLYGRERFAEASDVFRLVILCRPRQARGWLALAACHEGLGDDDRAIALYKLATIAPSSNSNRRRARLYLARLYAKLGRHAEARDELESLEGESCDDDETIERAIRDLRRCLVDTMRSMETAR